MILIDGKATAKKVFDEVKSETQKLEKKPTIAVIIVGEDPASKIYVNIKHKKAKEVGINSMVIELDEDISQQQLEKEIDRLNKDDSVNAILVQMPLPKHLDTYRIIEKISPLKDVDGFHPENAGKNNIGIEAYAYPCTPYGVMKLLEEYNINPEGKHAVIIGRSNIVSKPLASMLLSKNATVTICHSKTKNLKEMASSADILVVATGRPKMVDADFVKEGAVVIDVGISRDENGKIQGDVDFDSVASKTSYITPVPGGVGAMTIAMLMNNTLRLCKIQNELKTKC